jgi:uncharacterized protein YbjQ (UPF0145 family)
MSVITGLSGNEIYCLHKKGYSAGDLVVGNSVWSLGLFSQMSSAVKTVAGGEIHEYTEWISNGRKTAVDKLTKEVRNRGGLGVTGMTSEIIRSSNGIEFISVGSTIHKNEGAVEEFEFSTSADGQGLYCQLDCGFHPIAFVFGNVAYSVGLGGGVMGTLRSMGRGEVKEWSDIFDKTRHLALERIVQHAVEMKANAVLSIQTTLAPFMGVTEMIMVGTASHHPELPEEYSKHPITSDLTNEEMWNLIHLGYVPVSLVLGVSVYSLGIGNSFSAFFKSFSTGEIPEVTNLVYDARENAISKIARDMERVGADRVVGVKTYIKEIASGVIEFMAIGTAVKKMPNIKTLSENLPPQAIIRDIDTLIQPGFGNSAMDLTKT